MFNVCFQDHDGGVLKCQLKIEQIFAVFLTLLKICFTDIIYLFLLSALVRLQKNVSYGFNEHLDVPQVSAAVEAYILQKWGEDLPRTESSISGSNGIQRSNLSSLSQLGATLDATPV